MRIGQRFGLNPQSVIEIGETLSGVGPAMGSLLREQVLTRRFDTGLALGHVLKGLRSSSVWHNPPGCMRRLLAQCRVAWAEAESGIGSGADQSELIRWLESVVVQEPKNEV